MKQPLRNFITHPSPSPSPYHIFFLPGNPGLVEYYAGFLSQLHEKLNDVSSHKSPDTPAEASFPSFSVAGSAFAGFEARHDNDPEIEKGDTLYNITEQIDFSLARLREYIQASSSSSQKEKAKIVLIGHSFGTFVVAEMMKQVFSNGTDDDSFEIIGSILLFPPIPDLAESPRGKSLARVARWKYTPTVASYAAKLITRIPLNWSNALIQYVTGLPSNVLDTVQQFLGSRTGVAQALYLGNFELDELKLSRWESAFRAVVSAQQKAQQQKKATYIRLFFGKDDGWVHDELRDAFIYKFCADDGPLALDAKRKYLDIRAQIDPSADGDEGSVVIPHDFTTRHTEHVVPYVVEYVEEMVNYNTPSTGRRE